MRKDAWELGTWGRIPVSMHWTVLLSMAWLFLFTMNPVGWIVAAICFLGLLVAHEFGHVYMLRRRRVPVVAITLYGLHGETHYDEYSLKKASDSTAVAWGGVAAQAVVLVVAVAIYALVDLPAPWLAPVASAAMLVFTFINIFLMVLALLPIGPFDGHAAWAFIPRMRAKAKKKQQKAAVAKAKPAAPPPPPPEPEVQLSEEQQRELDQSAERQAAELIKKLTGKSGANNH